MPSSPQTNGTGESGRFLKDLPTRFPLVSIAAFKYPVNSSSEATFPPFFYLLYYHHYPLPTRKGDHRLCPTNQRFWRNRFLCGNDRELPGMVRFPPPLCFAGPSGQPSL